jgi:uncharacterized protein (UPF0261 family)
MVDAFELRGLPMLAPSVERVVPGTDPLAALLSKRAPAARSASSSATFACASDCRWMVIRDNRGSVVAAGVLDATTTEPCDELVGGVWPAVPERLETAGRAGIPQVVSLGALDMVNVGLGSSVPDRFRGRRLHEHTPAMSLMRTTPEECAELGLRIANKLNGAEGPVAVFVPLRGVSSIAVEGGPFHDPDADAALAEALRTHLDRSRAELHEFDLDINDSGFAEAMAIRLHELCQS